MDSIDYADPETINGLDLYAYCGNNPVIAGNDINWGNVAISGGIGAFFGFLSGGGAQHGRNATLKTKLADRKVKISKGKPNKSIDAQIKNEKMLLSKAAIKAQMPCSLWSYSLILQYVAYGTFSAYQHKR